MLGELLSISKARDWRRQSSTFVLGECANAINPNSEDVKVHRECEWSGRVVQGTATTLRNSGCSMSIFLLYYAAPDNSTSTKKKHYLLLRWHYVCILYSSNFITQLSMFTWMKYSTDRAGYPHMHMHRGGIMITHKANMQKRMERFWHLKFCEGECAMMHCVCCIHGLEAYHSKSNLIWRLRTISLCRREKKFVLEFLVRSYNCIWRRDRWLLSPSVHPPASVCPLSLATCSRLSNKP